MPNSSQSIEDYLERIYELIQEKGYARAVDIAGALSIRQSSVTKMIKNLDEKGYVVYEKYRGLTLTPKGAHLARSVRNRHGTLEKLLRLLGVAETILQRDVEGIEHHISPKALRAIGQLVTFLDMHPEFLRAFKRARRGQER